jgi:hypothetical protein
MGRGRQKTSSSDGATSACWPPRPPAEPGRPRLRARRRQLAAAHPGLLAALFPLLAPSDAQLAAGAGRVQLLATELLSELLGPGTFGSDAQQERATLEAALGALLSLADAAGAPGEAGGAAARAAAVVAGALAERDAELLGGASASALPLAQLMLRCVERPEREVRLCSGEACNARSGPGLRGASRASRLHRARRACIACAATASHVPRSHLNAARSAAVPVRHAAAPLPCSLQVCQAAVEYFLMVNTVPVSARHPQMGAPLYGALARPLLAHCCYPEGFEGWADCVEEDEEAFGR